jgi:arsenate reductase-like glutaredoxin family protein
MTNINGAKLEERLTDAGYDVSKLSSALPGRCSTYLQQSIGRNRIAKEDLEFLSAILKTEPEEFMREEEPTVEDFAAIEVQGMRTNDLLNKLAEQNEEIIKQLKRLCKVWEGGVENEKSDF